MKQQPQQPLDYAHDDFDDYGHAMDGVDDAMDDLDDYTRGIGFADMLYGTIFAIIGLCVFLLLFVVGE